MSQGQSVTERFFQKIQENESTGCWIWMGSGERYGSFYYKGTRWQAHRASFDMFCESVPDELNVLHTCDYTRCVNPAHLFLGSQQDNVTDMVTKGRASFGGDRSLFGSKNGMARLDETKVKKIKSLLREGYSHNEIAGMFNVARQTITNISTGIRWGHIQ